MKKCSKCGIEKPTTGFSKDKSKKDGFNSTCKSCRAQYYAQNKEKIKEERARYYAQNKEKIKEERARYCDQNKEKIKQRHARYYAQNKEKIKQRHAQYLAQNKEKIKEQRARYYAQNKEKIKQRHAQYLAQNKEKIKEQRARYCDHKKAEQPNCVYCIKNLINNKVYIGETIKGEASLEKASLQICEETITETNFSKKILINTEKKHLSGPS
jgi:exonuclease VII large subunit